MLKKDLLSPPLFSPLRAAFPLLLGARSAPAQSAPTIGKVQSDSRHGKNSPGITINSGPTTAIVYVGRFERGGTLKINGVPHPYSHSLFTPFFDKLSVKLPNYTAPGTLTFTYTNRWGRTSNEATLKIGTPSLAVRIINAVHNTDKSVTVHFGIEEASFCAASNVKVGISFMDGLGVSVKSNSGPLKVGMIAGDSQSGVLSLTYPAAVLASGTYVSVWFLGTYSPSGDAGSVSWEDTVRFRLP